MELDFSKVLDLQEFNRTITVYHVIPPRGRGCETYKRNVLHNTFWQRSDTLFFGRGPNGQKTKYPIRKNELLLYIPMQEACLQLTNEYTKCPFVPGDFIALGEKGDVNSISELRTHGEYLDEGLYRVKNITPFYYSHGTTNLWGAVCV